MIKVRKNEIKHGEMYRDFHKNAVKLAFKAVTDYIGVINPKISVDANFELKTITIKFGSLNEYWVTFCFEIWEWVKYDDNWHEYLSNATLLSYKMSMNTINGLNEYILKLLNEEVENNG